MEPERTTATRRLSRWQAGILTAGAAAGMVLAGLGVAGAQTNETPTTDPPGRQMPAEGNGEGRKAGCHRGHHVKAGLDVAANTIGVTLEELRMSFRSGQSIAQVAHSKGVDPQKVIDAMVADAKQHLADAVESGRLTQAEADQKAERVTERITDVVNRERLRAGRHRGPRA